MNKQAESDGFLDSISKLVKNFRVNGRITVTEPVGMEWDSLEQKYRYQNKLKQIAPWLDAHFVRGHGGGGQAGWQFRPRSRFTTDPEELKLNARNTREVRESLVEAYRKRGCPPELLFLGMCNKGGVNVPDYVKSTYGKLPARMVYAPEGKYNSTSVSGDALEYAATKRRPFFFKDTKDFVNSAIPEQTVRADIQPWIPPDISIPVATGLAAAGLGLGYQKLRKKKVNWGLLGLLGLGAAGTTALIRSRMDAASLRSKLLDARATPFLSDVLANVPLVGRYRGAGYDFPADVPMVGPPAPAQGTK